MYTIKESRVNTAVGGYYLRRYLIFVGPKGGDGELGSQPVFTWKMTLQSTQADKITTVSDWVVKSESEWRSEAVFTSVGRHVPYRVGQGTLVYLEITQYKTNKTYSPLQWDAFNYTIVVIIDYKALEVMFSCLFLSPRRSEVNSKPLSW